MCLKPHLHQFLATITALLAVFAMGVTEAWTSVYIPQLISGAPGASGASGAPLRITEEEGSWVAVLLNVGGVVGAALSPLADRFGRKRTMLLASVPYLLSSLLLAFADSVLVLYAARVAAGVAVGVTWCVTPLYIGEIAHQDVRGALGTGLSIMNILGFLFINIVGSYWSIRVTSFILCGVVAVFVAGFACMPESPYFLVKVDRLDEAKRVLKRFRGGDDVDKEFERIKDSLRVQSERSGKLMDVLRVRGNQKALVILFVVINGKQFTGSGPMDSYGQTIFHTVSDVLSPMYICVLYYTTRLVVIFINFVLIDKVGRKPFLLVSLFAIGITLFLLGIYLYLKLHTSIEIGSIFQWLSIVLLLLFATFYSFCVAIPVIILSELFLMNVKPFASLSFGIHYFLSILAGTKFFQVSSDSFGIDVPIFTFSASCFLHFILVYLFMFETKGKSLEEIQKLLENL